MSEEKQTIRTTLDLDPDLHQRVKMKALTERVPLVVVARRLLEGWVSGEIEVDLSNESEEASD